MTDEADRPPGDRFWQFSLDLYERPGVAEACLALQDRHGLNVNILLWCCWHAAEGRALGAAEIAEAEARTATLDVTVVRPLRAMRRRLKEGVPGVSSEDADDLRTAIKAAEFGAEKVAQSLLAAEPAGSPHAGPLPTIAQTSLLRYVAVRGIAVDGEVRADLEMIAIACEPSPTR
jgi:uncharacterized protein (TIGR02444 family)